MPASVLRVEVAKGDGVTAGQVVAVLEAMKIQVQIAAPTAGTVRAVHARVGDVVAKRRDPDRDGGAVMDETPTDRAATVLRGSDRRGRPSRRAAERGRLRADARRRWRSSRRSPRRGSRSSR